MERTLKDFLYAHAGATAWLFGKGPTLDRFDMATAGPLRVAINDVVKEVPGCLYGFANDSVADWAHVYRPGQVLFQPVRLWHDIHAKKCPVACERVWYEDKGDNDRLRWDPAEAAARGLAIRRGTLGSVGQILRIMGVQRIVCVGIDGGGQHSAKGWHTRLRADHATDYNEIRNEFIKACDVQGLELEFFDPNKPTMSNGKKRVRIVSQTFCRGKLCMVGQIHDLAPADADELVQAHRAIYLKDETTDHGPRDDGTTETASAAPEVETPEAPAKRKRKVRA